MKRVPVQYRGFFEHVYAEARKQGFDPVVGEWVIPAGNAEAWVVVRSPRSKTGKRVVKVRVSPYKRNPSRKNPHVRLVAQKAGCKEPAYEVVEIDPVFGETRGTRASGLSKAEAERMVRENPRARRRRRRNGSVEESTAAFKAAHWGEEPSRVQDDEVPTGKHWAELGELKEVVYETSKGGEGTFEWEHKFSKRRPLLVFNATGLAIVRNGSRYKVNRRGIVG